jgi:hypothetical protein
MMRFRFAGAALILRLLMVKAPTRPGARRARSVARVTDVIIARPAVPVRWSALRTTVRAVASPIAFSMDFSRSRRGSSALARRGGLSVIRVSEEQIGGAKRRRGIAQATNCLRNQRALI